MTEPAASADPAVRKSFHVIAVMLQLLAFAGFEVAARVFELAPVTKSMGLDDSFSVYQRSDNPLLGFELKPNYRNESPDNWTSYTSTNSHGQRDVERSIEKPPGIRRIVVLGDSVIEGAGLHDLEDTLTRQLERRLGDETEVLNFGVSGYCTLAEVELFEKRALRFSPDTVIVVFVSNDFNNFNTQLVQLEDRAPKNAFVRWLFHASFGFRAVALQLGWFLADDDPLGRSREVIGDENVVDGLERLRALADREGFDVFIAIWPLFKEKAIIEPDRMPDESGDLVIEQIAAAFEIPTVRMAPYFRRHHSREGHSEISPRGFYSIAGDDVHPSKLGNEIAAAALEGVLRDGIPERTGREGERDAESFEAATLAAKEKGSQPLERFKPLANTGIALERVGRHEEAIGYYERAIATDPPTGWTAMLYLSLGSAQEAVGDYAAARAAYERSAELRPRWNSAAEALQRMASEGH